MTELTRAVRRGVLTTRGQSLVVVLAPEGIWVREKRRRTSYLLPYGIAWQHAAELYARAERKRKAEERKTRRRITRGLLTT